MLDKSLLNKFPSKDHTALSLLPDFLPYDFKSKEDYEKYVKTLFSNSPFSYLMVDGAALKRVNWFTYAWQSLKGVLGFRNLCDQKWVQFNLKKIGYWGYLKQYNLDLKRELSQSLEDKTFADDLCCKRSSYLSSYFQTALVKDHKKNQYLLDTYFSDHSIIIDRYKKFFSFSFYSSNYTFGSLFLAHDCYLQLSQLDVQSKALRAELIDRTGAQLSNFFSSDPYFKKPYIDDLIESVSSYCSASHFLVFLENKSRISQNCALKLDVVSSLSSDAIYQYPNYFVPLFIYSNQIAQAYSVLTLLDINDSDLAIALLLQFFTNSDTAPFITKNSKFAHVVAIELMYLSALNIELSISIYEKTTHLYPDEAISLFLSQSKIKQAADVIEAIPASQHEKALDLLIKHFKSIEQVSALTCDTPLAIAFSNYWMKDSKSSTLSIKRATRFLSGFTKDEHYLKAGILNTNIALEYAADFFHQYVKHENWNKAEQLFFKVTKEERALVYAARQSDVKLLSKYLWLKGEELYTQAKTFRDNNNFDSAKPLYYFSLQKKINAHVVFPTVDTQEDVAIHYRLYAQVIFDKAIYNNEIMTDDDFSIILEYIKEAKNNWLNDKTDKYLTQFHLNVLYKKSILLRQSLLRTNLENTLSTEFISRTMDKALENILLLKEIFILNQTIPSKKINKVMLAASYFLMAEIIDEYELMNEGAALFYYQKAVELLPKHPYYLLRLSESLMLEDNTLQDEYAAQGLNQMREMGFNGASDYTYWYDERWLLDSEKSYKLPSYESLKCHEEPQTKNRQLSFIR